MSKKTGLQKGWLRASVREGRRRAGAGVLIGVVLLPAWLDSVLTMIKEQFTAWQLFTAVVLLVAIIFAFNVAWSARRHVRETTGLITNKLEADELTLVTGVVTMVSNMGAPREKAFQSIARQLPELRVVYAITCPGEEQQADLLRDWLSTAAPSVRLQPMHTPVDRHRPSDATVEALASELRLLRGAGTIVDITADNALCTVVLYDAAMEAGLPVSFLASSSPTHPYQSEFALVAIQDPEGTFEAARQTDPGPEGDG